MIDVSVLSREEEIVEARERGLVPHRKQRRIFISTSPLVATMASEHESNNPPTDSGHHHHKSSTSDLFSSAKVLADAAKSAASRDGAAVDRTKVAEAGEELLGAASEYGKLEEKGYGSYIQKAEGYLHQFHSSDKPTHSSVPVKEAVGGEHPAPEEKSTHKKQLTHEEHPSEDQSGGGFGGFGGYMKIADGFFKK